MQAMCIHVNILKDKVLLSGQVYCIFHQSELYEFCKEVVQKFHLEALELRYLHLPVEWNSSVG